MAREEHVHRPSNNYRNMLFDVLECGIATALFCCLLKLLLRIQSSLPLQYSLQCVNLLQQAIPLKCYLGVQVPEVTKASTAGDVHWRNSLDRVCQDVVIEQTVKGEIRICATTRYLLKAIKWSTN